MIDLSPEQKASYLKEKTEKFVVAMKEAEIATGMTAIAYLHSSPQGIIPRIAVVPINMKENAPSESKINP